MTTPSPTEPVVKSLTVEADCDTAFRVFTAQIHTWWPLHSHSLGGDKAKSCAFEPRVGGRLFETWDSGEERDWGRVTVWDPVSRIAFTWQLSRSEAEAGSVEITFDPQADGSTKVVLTHSGFEKLGGEGPKWREAYHTGWDTVLSGAVAAVRATALAQ